jgi:ankyrin repeat domain-containing protein 50
MDSLEREDNRRDIYRALLCLSKELDTTYSEAMQRIRSKDDRKVRRATQVSSWISYAVRQLTVKEIQYALAIEPEDRVMDEEALPDMGALISACAGLVIIGQKSNVIRLVYHTT